LERSVKEARRLAAAARRKARGRGARTKLTAARGLAELVDRCEKVARQIRQRVAGERITDRIVSLADPDARPMPKGKIGRPTEFGYVSQLAEVTEHTKRGARGLILPASHQIGNPSENTLLPGTVAELERLVITPQEIALDGGASPPPPPPRSPSSGPRRRSSPAARNRPPDAPSVGWRATEPG
jgi:IS5 family transposase